MLTWFIIGFVVGAVVCAIVAFFVWRNNKQKFAEAILELNAKIDEYDKDDKSISKVPAPKSLNTNSLDK